MRQGVSGLNNTPLYIAQVKQKCGIIEPSATAQVGKRQSPVPA